MTPSPIGVGRHLHYSAHRNLNMKIRPLAAGDGAVITGGASEIGRALAAANYETWLLKSSQFSSEFSYSESA